MADFLTFKKDLVINMIEDNDMRAAYERWKDAQNSADQEELSNELAEEVESKFVYITDNKVS
jgi:hypothetical protein